MFCMFDNLEEGDPHIYRLGRMRAGTQAAARHCFCAFTKRSGECRSAVWRRVYEKQRFALLPAAP